jgi:hypothetical protein
VVAVARSRSIAGTRGFSGTNAPPAFQTANQAAMVAGVFAPSTPMAQSRRFASRSARVNPFTSPRSSPRVVATSST